MDLENDQANLDGQINENSTFSDGVGNGSGIAGGVSERERRLGGYIRGYWNSCIERQDTAVGKSRERLIELNATKDHWADSHTNNPSQRQQNLKDLQDLYRTATLSCMGLLEKEFVRSQIDKLHSTMRAEILIGKEESTEALTTSEPQSEDTGSADVRATLQAERSSSHGPSAPTPTTRPTRLSRLWRSWRNCRRSEDDLESGNAS